MSPDDKSVEGATTDSRAVLTTVSELAVCSGDWPTVREVELALRVTLE